MNSVLNDVDMQLYRNAILINTRCIEIMRAFKGTWHLSDSEYKMCDEIGFEIARMIPEGKLINRLHSVTTDQILSWAETGTFADLPDENHLQKSHKWLKKISSKTAFWTVFCFTTTALWVALYYILIWAS